MPFDVPAAGYLTGSRGRTFSARLVRRVQAAGLSSTLV